MAALTGLMSERGGQRFAIGMLDIDSGAVSAVAGAATLNNQGAMVITSEALTTAAGADYVLTLTSNSIAATDMIFASVANGTNTTEGMAINRVQPAAGSAIIRVRNTGAGAWNGTIVISVLIVKQRQTPIPI